MFKLIFLIVMYNFIPTPDGYTKLVQKSKHSNDSMTLEITKEHWKDLFKKEISVSKLACP